MADPIPEALQLYSIRRALDISESARKEYQRLIADDSPRIIRRLARQRLHEYMQIMCDCGYLNDLERRAASVHIERTFVQHYPGYRDW